MSEISSIRLSGHMGRERADSTDAVRRSSNGEMSAPGGAEPRATSALKTFGMEVKHFFASLFGISIKQAKPAHVTTQAHAAQSTVAELTRRGCDKLEVLACLDDVCRLGGHTSGSNMSENGIDVGTLFRDEVAKLDDMQLFRTHKNLERHRDIGDVLVDETMSRANGDVGMTQAQLLTADLDEDAIMARLDNSKPARAIGYMAVQLREDVAGELKSRGFKIEERPHDPNPSLSPEVRDIVVDLMDSGKTSIRQHVDAIHQRIEDYHKRQFDEMNVGLEQINLGFAKNG